MSGTPSIMYETQDAWRSEYKLGRLHDAVVAILACLMQICPGVGAS
jgi:hypothetical protein